MADRGHVLTDKRLRDIERRMAEEYEQATEEMREKLIRFLNQFQAQDNVQRNLLKAGKITAKDYADWRYRHIMMNKRWAEMSATLAADYHNVNQIVAGIYRGERGDIYALNHNFAVYQMEHDGLMDTGLTLYDKDSVNRILQKNPQMLPPPGKKVSERIAAGVDVRWNNQQIQSVMLQGILQGDTIPELARRLEQVTERNYTAAVRNARTMATGAQNAGRLEAYKRATNLGVDLVEEWQATLDMRTRHDHRLMHGKRINVGEKWKTPQGELKFPGDPEGPPGEVYNCRCTTLSWVKGFEGDTIKHSSALGDMSFEEWQSAKSMSKEEQKAWIIAGKPNINTWENSLSRKAVINRRADEEQHKRYREILGDSAPKTIEAFQKMKYTKQEKWEELKSDYRQKRLEIALGKRNISTRMSEQGEILNPMPKAEYDRIKNAMLRQEKTVRAVLPTDNDDLYALMRYFGVEASYSDGCISHLGEVPSRGVLYEEIIHMAQARRYGELSLGDEVERCAREVEAARKLLKRKDAYRLDKHDVEALERNVSYWERRFKAEFGVGYDESNYRG